MLCQRLASARSPHGTSHTMLRPGMSGVPLARARVSREGAGSTGVTDCAASGALPATRQPSMRTRRITGSIRQVQPDGKPNERRGPVKDAHGPQSGEKLRYEAALYSRGSAEAALRRSHLGASSPNRNEAEEDDRSAAVASCAPASALAFHHSALMSPLRDAVWRIAGSAVMAAVLPFSRIGSGAKRKRMPSAAARTGSTGCRCHCHGSVGVFGMSFVAGTTWSLCLLCVFCFCCLFGCGFLVR